MKNKKILIVIFTHGDEEIGAEVVAALKARRLDLYFDELVANPKASKEKQRFIHFDLNRAYPGNAKSRYYEKKQAVKNLETAKKYRYVIDIHEASHGTNDFIIIPLEKTENDFPIENVDLKKVLLWPNPKGPLGQILNNSIELEFGMKGRHREVVVAKATNIVAMFMKEIAEKKRIERKKDRYYVYGELRKGEKRKCKNLALKDFRLVKAGKESFYPLLVNQYLTEGIICYKMKKTEK